jgi:uncharacterized protein
LQRAKQLSMQKRLDWPVNAGNVLKSLMGERLSVDEFLDLDDVTVTNCFKFWSHSKDQPLADLCRGLLYRGLFKTIDLTRVDGDEHVQAIVAASQNAVTKAGGDAEYEMFYDEPSDTPYTAYQPDQTEAASEILVADADGQLREFAAISPLPGALNRQLMFRRLHVAPKWRELVTQTIERMR